MIQTATFYAYDPYNRVFSRLATVESPGLISILTKPLKDLYPDNLYWIQGQGKKTLKAHPNLIMNAVK